MEYGLGRLGCIRLWCFDYTLAWRRFRLLVSTCVYVARACARRTGTQKLQSFGVNEVYPYRWVTKPHPSDQLAGFYPLALPQGVARCSSTGQTRGPYTGLAPTAGLEGGKLYAQCASTLVQLQQSPGDTNHALHTQQVRKWFAVFLMHFSNVLGSKLNRMDQPLFMTWYMLTDSLPQSSWPGILYGNYTMPNFQISPSSIGHGNSAMPNFYNGLSPVVMTTELSPILCSACASHAPTEQWRSLGASDEFHRQACFHRNSWSQR